MILIRHGHAVRVNGRYLNVPLTPLGQKQANLTGAYLCKQQEHFDGFYCSPLPRARETAARIGVPLKQIPHIRHGIQEWETLEVPLLIAFETLAHTGILGQYLYTHSGKPFWWPVAGRVSKVLTGLIAQHPNQRIAVVVHSGIISSVLAWYFPERRRHWWSYTMDNCSLTKLLIDGTHAQLVRVNNTDHLRPEETTTQPPAESVIAVTGVEKAVDKKLDEVQGKPPSPK
ncbi:MAG: histidine phosphatase family protein [Anaerolineae bacterium]